MSARGPLPGACLFWVQAAVIWFAFNATTVLGDGSSSQGCSDTVFTVPAGYPPNSWSQWFGGNGGQQLCALNANTLGAVSCPSNAYITSWTAGIGQADDLAVGGVSVVAVDALEAVCSNGAQLAKTQLGLNSPTMTIPRLGGFMEVSGRDGLALDAFVTNLNSTGGSAWSYPCPKGAKVVGYQVSVAFKVILAIRFTCKSFPVP